MNEARASIFYLRASVSTLDQIHPSDIGLTPINPSFNVMPVIAINGLFSIGGGQVDGSRAPEQTYEFSDQITWTAGRHTVRGGFDYQRVVYNFIQTGTERGSLTFNTFSDFLLGESAAQNGSPTGLSNIQTTASTVLPPGGSLNLVRVNQASSFLQDDFKISPKLTLNLGVRWEYAGTAYDIAAQNGGDNPYWNLLETVPVPSASGTYVGYTVAANFNGTLPDGVFRRSTNLLTTGHAPVTNFAPRFGFAYQPFGNSGKFVIRGGIGGFYQVQQGNIYVLEMSQNPPVGSRFSHTGAVNGAATLANPYNPPVFQGSFLLPNFIRTTTSALTLNALDPNLLTPETYAFNLSLQYALTRTTSLEVGYVGTRGEHIITGTTLDEPQIASPSNPVNCSYPSGCITTNTSANTAQRVPVLGIAPNGFVYGTNAGDSIFHSFQTTLRHQLAHGFLAQVAYTFGKTMTDIAGTSFIGGYAGTVTSNDPNNRAQQRGEADYDRRQRVVAKFSYQIPDYDKGSGVLGTMLSHWMVTGVSVIQRGQPLTFTDTGGAIIGVASSRAQMCPGFTYDQILTSGPISSRLSSFFNPNAFADTLVTKGLASCPFPTISGLSAFGNTGRAILAGPGQFNWDMSIVKNIRLGGIRESGMVQFRADFFNAFNHPQFANPSTVVNTAAFGNITSTTVAPRIIQLALRYSF